MSYLPLNAIGTVRRLSTNTYVVTRSNPGSYDVNGRAVAGSTTTLTIYASIQPLGGGELEYLPEGLRTDQVVAVWTDTRLQTTSVANATAADVIQYGTDTYEVKTVEDWSESGKIFKCLAVKQGQ